MDLGKILQYPADLLDEAWSKGWLWYVLGGLVVLIIFFLFRPAILDPVPFP